MPCRDASLIVGGRSGWGGCPCALALSFPDSRGGRDPLEPELTSDLRQQEPNDGRRLAHAALLVFGAPLLLLLLSAAAAAVFAAHQPLWALAGMVLLPGIALGARLGFGRALQTPAR